MSGTYCFPIVPDFTDMSRKPRILDDTIFVVTGEAGSNQLEESTALEPSPISRKVKNLSFMSGMIADHWYPSADHFGRLGMTKDFVFL